MDIASLIGLIGAVGMIVGAMMSSGGIGPFLHLASTLIVVGGTFSASCIQRRFPVFWPALA